MKYRKKLQMLLISGALMSIIVGCTPPQGEKLLIPVISGQEITTETALLPMSRDLSSAFMDGERTFVLYFGSPRCHYCINLEPLLADYVTKTKIELYYVNTIEADFNGNIGYYDETFAIRGTPTILFVKAGEIVHREVGSQNLKNELDVSKFFRDKIYTSNYVHYLQTPGDERISEKEVNFTFDFMNVEHQKIINTYFYPHFGEPNFNVSIINSLSEPKQFSMKYLDSGEVVTLSNLEESQYISIAEQLVTYFK